MNERIRELAEQAKGFVDLNQHVGGEKGCMVYTYDGLEKFAELIVRDCLDIVANADMAELEGPDLEDVLYVACKQIREHFGVEE